MIHLQQSFNGGQMGPFLHNRGDIDKFRSGLRESLNSIPTPYGPTRRRPGLLYVGNTKVNADQCRIINFDVNSDSGYVLELGDQSMRFYKDMARIQVTPGAWVTATAYAAGETAENGGTGYVCEQSHTSGATTEPGVGASWADYWYPLADDGAESVYELPTPWDDADLRQIQVAQVNDTMYFVHPDYPVQILSRFGDDQWSLADLEWSWPPMRDQNLSAITMTPSATSGAITVTASAAAFDADMVGGHLEIRHKRASDEWESKKILSGTGASTPILVRGEYQFRTGGVWDATVVLQESSDGGGTWEDIREFVSKSDDNFIVTYTTSELRLVRVNCTARASSTDAFASVEAVDAFVPGWVTITGFTSSVLVSATVGSALYSTSATADWSEGAFSTFRGHPRAVTLHELRLVLGGTAKDKNTVWASQTDDFPNFETGTDDDEAWRYTLASTEHNTINWMASQKQLLIGSSGGEWVLDSGKDELVITPTNRRARRHSNYGSEHLQALAVDSSTLFIRSGGQRLADFTYVFEQDGYDSNDLNLLSYDITKGGIIETAYQRKRDPIIWVVVNGGGAACMAYNRRQAVTGWSPVLSPGSGGSDEIESVAVVGRAGDEDEVWFVVRRVVNGFTVRYLEVMDPDSYDRQEDCAHYDSQEGLTADTGTNLEDLVFLDSAVVCSVAAAAGETVASGLDHLVGEEVVAFCDGSRQGDTYTVDGSGEITIQGEFTKVLAGMAYKTRCRTLPLFNQLQTGSSRSREVYIHQAVVFLHRSGPFSIGVYDDPEGLQEVPLRSTAIPEGDPTPMRDGEFEIVMGGSHTKDPSVVWETSEPTPLTVEALALKYQVNGE